jgi:transposase
MASGHLWAGLDLGSRQTHVCVIDDAGLPLREESCETNLEEISRVLAEAAPARIDLIAAEASSDTHIVRKLRDAGLPIAIFEARKSSRFLAIRRSKTDASDARGLADLARLGRHTVSQVHLKSLECQQLRNQLATRQTLVRMRVAIEGSVRSRLALYGRPLRRCRSPDAVRKQVTEEVESLRAEEGIEIGEDLKPLLDIAQRLRAYVAELDRSLKAKANAHPVCSRLMAVTGVGPICSLSFYSAIEDPSRFKRPSDVAAYLGLVPRRHQSGEVSYTRGITKTGNTMTRTHLVNSALVFTSKGPDSDLRDWALALRERIGWQRTRVALARKLAIVLLIMWKTGAEFEPRPH